MAEGKSSGWSVAGVFVGVRCGDDNEGWVDGGVPLPQPSSLSQKILLRLLSILVRQQYKIDPLSSLKQVCQE
jgi:hypothetical protein